MLLIRPGTKDDRIAIHEIRKQAWKKAYAGLLPESVIAEATDDSRLQQPARGGLLIPDHIAHSRVNFVACRGDQIVGFVSGCLPRETEPPADCELWAIYVHPSEQGKGAGRELFRAFRECMREKKHRKMILWALKANMPSRGFYEQMGGQLESVEKPFKWHGQVIAQEVGYSWNLEE